MARWHVGSDGIPRICTADSAESCPIAKDGIVRHFENKAKAYDYGEWVSARNAFGESIATTESPRSHVRIVSNASRPFDSDASVDDKFASLDTALAKVGLEPTANSVDMVSGIRSRVYSASVSGDELSQLYDEVRSKVDYFNEPSALMVIPVKDGRDTEWEWRGVDPELVRRVCDRFSGIRGLSMQLVGGDRPTFRVYTKREVNPRYIQAICAQLDTLPRRTPVHVLEIHPTFSESFMKSLDGLMRRGQERRGGLVSDVRHDGEAMDDWLKGGFDHVEGIGDSSTAEDMEAVRDKRIHDKDGYEYRSGSGKASRRHYVRQRFEPAGEVHSGKDEPHRGGASGRGLGGRRPSEVVGTGNVRGVR